MSDVLCIYYSRTGNTKRAMKEIAEALGAETLELHDNVSRSGWKGWVRCGLDAMRKTVQPVGKFKTKKPLQEYRLVILGTPVWASRCSSVMRSFLKDYGKDIQSAAYVLIRGSEDKNEDIYEQMDQYLTCGHCAAVSLRADSVGYTFWQEEFLRQVRGILEQK